METMFDTLLQLPLFQGLCQEDFTNILDKVKLHFTKYKPGERLIPQGSPCDRLCFLLKGEIAMTTTSKDDTYTVMERLGAPYVIEPQSLFGMNVTLPLAGAGGDSWILPTVITVVACVGAAYVFKRKGLWR